MQGPLTVTPSVAPAASGPSVTRGWNDALLSVENANSGSVPCNLLTRGVIGNTQGFGPCILGSSPSGSAVGKGNDGKGKHSQCNIHREVLQENERVLSGARLWLSRRICASSNHRIRHSTSTSN